MVQTGKWLKTVAPHVPMLISHFATALAVVLTQAPISTGISTTSTAGRANIQGPQETGNLAIHNRRKLRSTIEHGPGLCLIWQGRCHQHKWGEFQLVVTDGGDPSVRGQRRRNARFVGATELCAFIEASAGCTCGGHCAVQETSSCSSTATSTAARVKPPTRRPAQCWSPRVQPAAVLRATVGACSLA